VDAVRAAHHQRVLELVCAPFADLAEARDVLDDDVDRLCHLEAQRRVAEVRARHAVVNVLALLTDVLGHVGEERDHVVVGCALDLVDALHREAGLLADDRGGLHRDDAELRLRPAREDLDLLPDLVFVGERPDPAHLRARVAFDHLGSPWRGGGRHEVIMAE
jgi:hypothetical protein